MFRPDVPSAAVRLSGVCFPDLRVSGLSSGPCGWYPQVPFTSDVLMFALEFVCFLENSAYFSVEISCLVFITSTWVSLSTVPRTAFRVLVSISSSESSRLALVGLSSLE